MATKGDNEKKVAEEAADNRKSRFRPKKTLVTSAVLIVLLLMAVGTQVWASSTKKNDVPGLPIGEPSDTSFSYCIFITPEKVEGVPGTNMSFRVMWRATHWDCPNYLPFGKTTEGLEQVTKISTKNLDVLNETDWQAVPGIKDTFGKTIVVRIQDRDGYINIVRKCPYYSQQTASAHIDVPDDHSDEQQGKTLGAYYDIWKRDPAFVTFALFAVTLVPMFLAARFLKSINSVRLVTQFSFFMGLNLGFIGLWTIRTSSLPLGAALPGAACNYLFYGTGNCVVYQMEHFFSAGIWNVLPYFVMLLLVFMIFFIAFGRAWCGWACPLGSIQDIASAVRRKLGFKRHHLSPFQREVLLVTKYSTLFIGMVLSIMISISILTYYLPTDEMYRPICQVCPGYPLFAVTQTVTGIAPSFGIDEIPFWSILMLSAFLVTSFVIRRPFCRICPIGGLMGMFYKVAGVSLHKDGTRCTKCGMCYRSCPVDVIEVMEQTKKDDITTPDCILCMRCVELCPEEGCLSGKVMGINVTNSSYRKFMLQHPVSLRNTLQKYATKPKKGFILRLWTRVSSRLKDKKVKG